MCRVTSEICFTKYESSFKALDYTKYWIPPGQKIQIPWVKKEMLGNVTCRNLGRSERRYHELLLARDKSEFKVLKAREKATKKKDDHKS